MYVTVVWWHGLLSLHTYSVYVIGFHTFWLNEVLELVMYFMCTCTVHTLCSLYAVLGAKWGRERQREREVLLSSSNHQQLVSVWQGFGTVESQRGRYADRRAKTEKWGWAIPADATVLQWVQPRSPCRAAWAWNVFRKVNDGRCSERSLASSTAVWGSPLVGWLLRWLLLSITSIQQIYSRAGW